MKKTALVLEGGGLRGIFTSGVIDCFIDNKIDFDYVVGVSAGSCNAFEYISKSRGFIKNCMLQSDRKNSFYGVQQMMESHKFVNLDKVFYEYTEQYGFDFDAFKNSKIKWEFVVTNMLTGDAEYMHSDDLDFAREIGRASCSLPLITKPVILNDVPYLDGGVADSIPIERALEKGYDRIVVVCTRKKGSYSGVSSKQIPLFEAVYKEYPNFINTVKNRTKEYRRQVGICESLEKEGKVILIRPTIPEVSRLESDLEELSLSYYHGYTKTKDYINQIKKW